VLRAPAGECDVQADPIGRKTNLIAARWMTTTATLIAIGLAADRASLAR